MRVLKTGISWKLVLILLWLVLTLSLAVWWLILGLEQAEQIHQLSGSASREMFHYRTMLLWEGVAWMILLIAGGLTLIYFVFQEKKRAQKLREFFGVFSHDLKTSLASLRLQVESLMEDMGAEQSPVFQRLVGDTVRLQLQLENSLFLANIENWNLYVQRLSLRDKVHSVSAQWPQLEVIIHNEVFVHADEKACESILENVIQNAVIHGGADRIEVTSRQKDKKAVVVDVCDNGSGFKGRKKDLGRPFYRHQAASGSGIGLFIVQELMKKMNGRVSFHSRDGGFCVELEFLGELDESSASY